MKKYYASQLGNQCQQLNQYFDRVLKKERTVVYLGFGAELNVENRVIFIDDFGRGGDSAWWHDGEIYIAMKYMLAIMISGIIQGIAYDSFKKTYKLAKKIFKKTRKIKERFHYFILNENNSQYHFIFFSFMDEEDFEKAYGAIPYFVNKNKLANDMAVDCYFDTKSKKWHIVGKREIHGNDSKKYLIY